MKKLGYIIFMYLLFANHLFAQQNLGLISGPWAGNVELRTAMIWLEVAPTVKNIKINYYPLGHLQDKKTIVYTGVLGNEFNPVKVALNDLEVGTTYQYDIVIDNKKIQLPFTTKFTTKDLWQYRKPAPDFSFLTGSCAYFNEPVFDRPGKPYGGDSTIFETMANTPANFHVWLGDNWYTREVDYSSVWGLNYRASHDRSQKILQKFMAAMPQYAIWDDHDFGPNDASKSYIFKEQSRKIFNDYFLNPTCGEEGKGIYSLVNYGDLDLFLTDDRYFRSEDDMPDSINGLPNKDKTFFGPMQMEWLKNSLSFSRATFKIIVVGSQVLNTLNKFECMQHYHSEYNELIDFIASQNISGVIFLTGDRHHSEVIRLDRPAQYPLYDITVSPYTSGVSKVFGSEIHNPQRVEGTLVEAPNFARISVSGSKNDRKLKVEFLGVKGEKLGEWGVDESSLKNNAKK